MANNMSMLTVEEMCRKLKPVFGDRIDALYSQYALSDSMESRKEIEQVLNLMYQRYLNENMLTEKVLLEPPEEEIIKGDYPLGNVVYPSDELYSFGLREMDWPRHVLITGMSGSGKTNFAFVILGGFIIKQKPFMVFDWKKSFRPLMKVDDNILLFTIGNNKISNNFKFNINRPPKNVNPKEWIMALCDIMSEVFMTSFGVHKLLSEVLDKAYLDFGVYNGSNNYPTWLQIKDRLEDMDKKVKRGRESEWLTSAVRIAHMLTFGDFGDAVNYKGEDAMTVDELLSKQVIFEMNSLSTVEKKFFADYILTYIYKLKKANYETVKEFNHAILVDEAHNIFLKDKPNFNTESVTDVIYREIREYGTSLICLDQHTSKLSDVVVGNSACIAAFQQFLPSDLGAVSGVMQIFEKKKFFSMLPVGYAIVRLAERYQNPFLVKVPFVDVKNKMADDNSVSQMMISRFKNHKQRKMLSEGMSIDRLQKEIAKMDNTFKKSGIANPPGDFVFDNVKQNIERGNDAELKEQFHAKELSDKLGATNQNQNNNNSNPQDINKIIFTHIQNKIEKQHKDFLKELKENKNLGTAQIYKLIGVSVRKGNTIRDELVELGLIEVKEERNSKGWKKTFQPTKLALNLI